jgi:hypothetical protein
MYPLSGAQYFSSLVDVAWLHPKDGSVTPFSSGDGVHSYNVQSGLPQLTNYVGNSTDPIVSLDEEGGLGTNEVDASFPRCRKEDTSVGGHEVKLSATSSRWETGVGD